MKLSRRAFGSLIAASALARAGSAAETTNPEVEARINWIFTKYGSRLNDEQRADIRRIQHDARTRGVTRRPRWPMIVLQTPKGWTGPKTVDGERVEGTYRAHQVPLSAPRAHPESIERHTNSREPRGLSSRNTPPSFCHSDERSEEESLLGLQARGVIGDPSLRSR